MPTIKIRQQADGATRYPAIVRLRRKGMILHRESRTFTHRSAALSWAKHREVALCASPALKELHALGVPAVAVRLQNPLVDQKRVRDTQRERDLDSR